MWYKVVMPATKVCAQCCAAVNIKKSACDCGYSFVLKRKTSLSPAVKLGRRLKRAAEPLSDTKRRQCADKLRRAQRRALETEDETLHRRETNRACTARKRASETELDALQRRETNRACTARKRATETKPDASQRRETNRACTARKRVSCIPIDKAITEFQSKVKLGPEYVCTCCHRMMYKQTVVPYNRSKYAKASEEMLKQVFSDEKKYNSFDGNVWVCKTCNRTLSRGNMPLQAKANNLELSAIPHELSDLNQLELRLVSLRVPFMEMVALPSGKQRSIHGPAVNVPSRLDTICSVLPRLPSQTELIPLKLKRKLVYRKHYMYDFISPEKVLNALRWLKANNPLYADVEINVDWLQESISEDSDLFGGLVGQPSTSETRWLGL